MPNIVLDVYMNPSLMSLDTVRAALPAVEALPQSAVPQMQPPQPTSPQEDTPQSQPQKKASPSSAQFQSTPILSTTDVTPTSEVSKSSEGVLAPSSEEKEIPSASSKKKKKRKKTKAPQISKGADNRADHNTSTQSSNDTDQPQRQQSSTWSNSRTI